MKRDNTLDERVTGPLVLMVDDKGEGRVGEIRDMLQRSFQGTPGVPELNFKILTSRTEALNMLNEVQNAPIVVISDIYTHPDIDIISFAREIRSLVSMIILYSANIEDALKEYPDLISETNNPIADLVMDRHGNLRKNLTNAIKTLFGLTEEPVSKETSEVPPTVQIWLDDIESGGRLGDRWSLIVGDPKERLAVSGPFLTNVAEKVAKQLERTPSTLIMGLGMAGEAIHFAKEFPDMPIQAVEIDPKLREQGEANLAKEGFEGRVPVMSVRWQELSQNLQESVDLIVSQGNELECLASRKDQRRVYKEIYDSLTIGGTFVMDLRNSAVVKKVARLVQNKGIEFLTAQGIHPSVPMYNGGGDVIAYPVAIQESPNSEEAARVWFNYPYTDPDRNEKEGGALLTMLLSELQDHIDMLNKAGFEVAKIYGDFTTLIKAKTRYSINNAPAIENEEDWPNFFQIIARKPVK